MGDILLEKPHWFDIKHYDYLSKASPSEWVEAFGQRITNLFNLSPRHELSPLDDWRKHYDVSRLKRTNKKELTDQHYKRPFKEDNVQPLTHTTGEGHEASIVNALREAEALEEVLEKEGDNISCFINELERLENVQEEYISPQPFIELEAPSLEFYARLLTLQSRAVHHKTGLSYEEIYNKKKARLQKYFHIPNDRFNSTMLSTLEQRTDQSWDENYQKKLDQAKDSWGDYSCSKFNKPSQRLLRVDTDTPDETLIELFKIWLNNERQESPLKIPRRGAKAKNLISEDIMRKWHSNRLIPLFDLIIFNTHFYRGTIKKTILAEWLYGDLNYANPSQQLSKAMKHLDSVLEIYDQLVLQAAGEDSFHK